MAALRRRDSAPPERTGQDDAKIVFALLANCTETPAGVPTVTRDVFCAQVCGGPCAPPELGLALWDAFHGAGAAERPERMGLGLFLRGVASMCADASIELLLERLWAMLAPAAPPSTGPLSAAAVAEVLARAYALDAGARPVCREPFESAGVTAAGYAIGAAFAEPTLRRERAFALWAARDLPLLAEVAAGHVERTLASAEAIDRASELRAAQLAASGRQPRGLSLEDLLLLDSDALRKHLAASVAREGAAREGGRDEAEAAAAGAREASAEADASALGGDEWLWLLSLALCLRGLGAQSAAPPTSARGCGWERLFATSQHGSSLHTLVDRIDGYGEGAGAQRGQLLLCLDGGGHVWGGWADRGFAPVAGVDFFGGDGCALVRLRPSLLVCRSARRLVRIRAAAGGARAREALGADGGGETVLRAAIARRRGSVGDSASGGGGGGGGKGGKGGGATRPLDQNYVLCNNKRASRRGLGMGGTLQAPRLWLAPSLEHGTALSACDTYAEGALASAPTFDVRAIEVWARGGREARRARDEWRWGQSEKRKRELRAFLRSELDDATDGGGGGGERGEPGGVVNGLGREDKWLIGSLLGRFAGAAAFGFGDF